MFLEDKGKSWKSEDMHVAAASYIQTSTVGHLINSNEHQKEIHTNMHVLK